MATSSSSGESPAMIQISKTEHPVDDSDLQLRRIAERPIDHLSRNGSQPSLPDFEIGQAEGRLVELEFENEQRLWL